MSRVTALAATALIAFVASPKSDDAKQVRVIDTAHMWEATLIIGKTPSWDGTRMLMTIVPASKGGKIYSPRNLVDAVQELDRMLPQNFIQQASAASAESCLKEANDTLVEIHNALADFEYEKWIENKKSAFRQYLDANFDLAAPMAVVAKDFDQDIGRTAGAWVLCYYYQAKHEGRLPSEIDAKAKFEKALQYTRKQWHQQ